jgi:hypothetical protein
LPARSESSRCGATPTIVADALPACFLTNDDRIGYRLAAAIARCCSVKRPERRINSAGPALLREPPARSATAAVAMIDLGERRR